MTTATAYALYLSRLAPNSQRSIASQMRSIAQLMDWPDEAIGKQLSSINYQQAMQIRALLIHEQWSARSINRAMTAIKSIVKVAALMGEADMQQVAHINSIANMKHGAHQGNPLSAEQVTKLLALLSKRQDTYGLRTLAIFALFLGTGLRRSELAALTLADYDSVTSTIKVVAGKGNKSRILFLPDWVEQHVIAWLNVRKMHSGPLICHCRTTGIMVHYRPVSRDALYRLVKDKLGDIGVMGASPHDLRRTFITRLLEQNVDINTVRQMAGHADISTTTIYDKRGDAFMREAAATLNYVSAPNERGGKTKC
ncbi:site-specific integrase [Shewanella sp. MM_2022_3]|uniref:tyrosine-type recombinase/integrase n=1 Tax=Shewanella sp. MM_2022_3 TaxID=2923280 RepID=UPI001F4C2765|nr:site-specific integrase [Shewanella sp. MM_2022_3]MCH7423895.1 site-specific integrase [Shewanella sp. MM_2022_3]